MKRVDLEGRKLIAVEDACRPEGSLIVCTFPTAAAMKDYMFIGKAKWAEVYEFQRHCVDVLEAGDGSR